MFIKKRNKRIDGKYDIDNYKNEIENLSLSNSLDSNIKTLKDIVSDDDTLIIRYVENQTNYKKI
jgi:hypothetical protein